MKCTEDKAPFQMNDDEYAQWYRANANYNPIQAARDTTNGYTGIDISTESKHMTVGSNLTSTKSENVTTVEIQQGSLAAIKSEVTKVVGHERFYINYAHCSLEVYSKSKNQITEFCNFYVHTLNIYKWKSGEIVHVFRICSLHGSFIVILKETELYEKNLLTVFEKQARCIFYSKHKRQDKREIFLMYLLECISQIKEPTLIGEKGWSIKRDFIDYEYVELTLEMQKYLGVAQNLIRNRKEELCDSVKWFDFLQIFPEDEIKVFLACWPLVGICNKIFRHFGIVHRYALGIIMEEQNSLSNEFIGKLFRFFSQENSSLTKVSEFIKDKNYDKYGDATMVLEYDENTNAVQNKTNIEFFQCVRSGIFQSALVLFGTSSDLLNSAVLQLDFTAINSNQIRLLNVLDSDIIPNNILNIVNFIKSEHKWVFAEIEKVLSDKTEFLETQAQEQYQIFLVILRIIRKFMNKNHIEIPQYLQLDVAESILKHEIILAENSDDIEDLPAMIKLSLMQSIKSGKVKSVARLHDRTCAYDLAEPEYFFEYDHENLYLPKRVFDVIIHNIPCPCSFPICRKALINSGYLIYPETKKKGYVTKIGIVKDGIYKRYSRYVVKRNLIEPQGSNSMLGKIEEEWL